MDLVFDSEMLFVEFNVTTWCGMSYSNVNSKQNVNGIVNSENVSSVTVTVKIWREFTPRRLQVNVLYHKCSKLSPHYPI